MIEELKLLHLAVQKKIFLLDDNSFPNIQYLVLAVLKMLTDLTEAQDT